jgi:hypothetical protein
VVGLSDDTLFDVPSAHFGQHFNRSQRRQLAASDKWSINGSRVVIADAAEPPARRWPHACMQRRREEARRCSTCHLSSLSGPLASSKSGSHSASREGQGQATHRPMSCRRVGADMCMDSVGGPLLYALARLRLRLHRFTALSLPWIGVARATAACGGGPMATFPRAGHVGSDCRAATEL